MNNRLRIPIVLLFALTLVMTSLGMPQAGSDVPLMTTDELNAMLDDPDLLVLDVRRGKDWTSSEFKIKGATYAKPEAYDTWANTYPKDKKIVLYCA
jgi:predicted sulfurtransferase